MIHLARQISATMCFDRSQPLCSNSALDTLCNLQLLWNLTKVMEFATKQLFQLCGMYHIQCIISRPEFWKRKAPFMYIFAMSVPSITCINKSSRMCTTNCMQSNMFLVGSLEEPSQYYQYNLHTLVSSPSTSCKMFQICK